MHHDISAAKKEPTRGMSSCGLAVSLSEAFFNDVDNKFYNQACNNRNNDCF